MNVVADSLDEFATDPEMVAMFVNNATDLIEQIETDLVTIEKVPNEERVAVVNRIFRSAHTIKGESGFVGLTGIGKLAHNMENILDQVRESKIEPSHKVVSTLLSSLDVLRSLIDHVETSNEVDLDETISSLLALDPSQPTAQTIPQPPPVVVPVPAPVALAPVAPSAKTPSVPVQAPPVLSKPASTTALTRTRVLVIDDEPIVRKLVVREFAKIDLALDQAESAEDAILLMRKNLYHVVICDLNLPGISGVELLPKLKAISPMVQVIMLTGDANLVTVLESLENGAVDFLPKSRNYAALLSPVCEALARVDRWMPLMRSRK